MTGTACTSKTLRSWQALQDTVTEFRPPSGGMEQFLEDLFDELEQLRDEYGRKLSDLETERQRLADREHALEEQTEAAEGSVDLLREAENQLSEALQEVERLREELRNRGSSGGSDVELQRELDATRQERDSLRYRLDQLESELSATRTSTTAELQELRRALAAAAERGEGVPLELERVDQLELERDELADELELVRSRAAELEEQIQEQRRELVDQRSTLTQELKELRRLMERQSDSTTSRTPAATATVSRKTAETSTGDPVVSSVMAQFARLQKDVVQRRKRRQT